MCFLIKYYITFFCKSALISAISGLFLSVLKPSAEHPKSQIPVLICEKYQKYYIYFFRKSALESAISGLFLSALTPSVGAPKIADTSADLQKMRKILLSNPASPSPYLPSSLPDGRIGARCRSDRSALSVGSERVVGRATWVAQPCCAHRFWVWRSPV